MSFIYRYEGRNQFPSAHQIKEAADKIGIDVPLMEAVIEVEAAGKWYRSDGYMVRRFEPHHAPKPIREAMGFRGNWRDSLKIATTTRRKMFMQAHAIDPEAAIDASSWGAFQIMGFNAERAGYPSALAMVHAFQKDVGAQLTAFVRFVKFIGADVDLRAQDFTGFARKYNGTGQPAVYGKKIANAYARRTGKGTPTVLRIGSSGASVRELQKALYTRGWSVEVDGHFGAETLEAVRAFQKAEGLPVDGMVGARTWAALRDTAAYSPKPELEKTESESFAEKVSGGTAAITAVTGAVTAVLGDDPSDATRQIMLIAMIGAAAAAAFFYWKKEKSKKARLHEYRMQ